MTMLTETLRTSGSGRCYHGGRVLKYDVTFERDPDVDYEFTIALEDGRKLTLSDAYDELGFVYLAADSGEEMFSIVVPLSDEEPDPVGIPDEASVKASAFDAMRPLYETVQQNKADPADIELCRQIFSSPEAMLRTIQREGGLAEARAAILRDMFRI